MEQETFVENQNQQPDPAPTLSQQAEKMISQSQADAIIKSRIKETADKTEQRVRQEYASYVPATSSLGGMTSPSLTKEDVERIATDAANKQHQSLAEQYQKTEAQRQGQKTIDEIMTKLNAAKDKYSDFDEKVGPLFSEHLGDIWVLANGVENTADVMYHLSENVEKISLIDGLIRRDPTGALARRSLAKMAESIKLNEQAAHVKTPNAPLSQIKPSPVGTDNGSTTINDLRRQPWLRG